ncbi:hypothetical protein [Streptomyces fagopyri]
MARTTRFTPPVNHRLVGGAVEGRWMQELISLFEDPQRIVR